MKFLHAVAQKIRAKMRPSSFIKPLVQEAPVPVGHLTTGLGTPTRRRPRVKVGFLRRTNFEAWRRKKVRRLISQESRRGNRRG